MPYETILLERSDDGVAILTLNRPESHNALNLRMVEEIHDVLGRFETSDEAKALVVTAAGGKAFMSGADIAELRERRRQDAWKGINTTLFSRLEAFPHPTVAAIEGWCMGGGCEMVTACDFRVAGQTSRFGQPEVGIGILAAAGATRRLPALVGLAQARRLLFTGEIIDAAEALRIGLVDRVVGQGEALGEAQRLLEPILEQAPEAVRRTKQMLLAWVHGAGEEALMRLECDLQADLFEHPEKFARMDAFLAKRRRKGT